MAWSAGTFSRFEGITGCATKASGGTGITAALEDQRFNEFATGINNCITKDGQNAATANLPMGGFKHTNVADASADTHYASWGQVKTNLARIYGRTTADTTITATTTETSLCSYTITGGDLGTTRGVRLHLLGYITNSSGGNVDFIIRAKFGATTLFACTCATATNGASRLLHIIFDVLNDASASAQVSYFRIEVGDAIAGTSTMDIGSSGPGRTANNYNASSENTASDKNLVITSQASSATSTTVVAKYSYVELI